MNGLLHRLLTRLPAKLLYFIALFTLLGVPGTVSGAPLQVPKNTYWIKLENPSTSQICVGQQVEIWGEFGVNPGTLPGIFGPDAIVTQAALGSTSPQNLIPGTYAGFFSFYYTANKEGDDQIRVTVKNTPQADVTSYPITLKVTKTCSYRFVLHAEVKGEFVSDEADIALKITLDSKGVLKAPNPGEPLKLESGGYIFMTEEVTKYEVPDCVDFTAEPGKGMGELDGKAEPSLDGYAMDVQLLRPNITGTIDMHATCVVDGERKEVSVFNAFALSQTENPGGAWIEQMFPSDGGTFHIKIDMLDKMVKNVQSGGGTGSYTATLTLERIEK